MARGRVSDQEFIGMGWSSPEIVGVTMDGLWEALTYKARKPQEFMGVDGVQVQDRQGYLWRTMNIRASNKTVVEHIYCSERKGEMSFRVIDQKSKRESDDERVIAVKAHPLHLEFYHRHKSDGYRSYWHAPTKVVQAVVSGLTELAKRLESNQDDKVGLGMLSPALEGVGFDAMWKSMVECVREPNRFMNVKVDSIQDRQGYLQRTTSANGKQVVDNIYVDERAREITYRLCKNGVEQNLERVVALRTHPLQLEFHARNMRDGFRIDWAAPKKAVLGVVDSYVREAKRMASANPSTIGYGMSSDPIQDCSYDSLMIAIEKTITNPALVMDIDPKATKIREEKGFIIRRFKLNANKIIVMEHVQINEENSEVVFNKLTSDGKKSCNDRVLSIQKDPLRLEFYERNRADGTRLNWTAPYSIGQQTMTSMVKIAKKIEGQDANVIGYGISSAPMKGVMQDNLWKSMLFCVRNPGPCGMNVSNVRIFDNDGYMTRWMNLNDKKGKPRVIDNVYVDEANAQISYRALELERGGESLDERLFAIRQQPLRLEMWCRHSKDELRVDWQAPKAVAQDVFGKIKEFALMMQNDPQGFDRKYGAAADESKQNGMGF